MDDTKAHELHVITTSPSKNLSIQPIGPLPEPHIHRKVLASIRSAKVELERFKKNHAQDGLGIRRLEDYITELQERERAKSDSALGSSHGSNNGLGDSGSSERRRLIEKNSGTPYRSPYQSIIVNRPIGLEAAIRASQNEIRNLEQAAIEATNEHKSATTLQRTEQTTTDHLTHYNQLLKKQILSRRQILDRLESTELEHDGRVDLDTNNETFKHDRRKRDIENQRNIWRAEREQQELKQHSLESQLNRQQKFDPKRDAKQMDTETRTEAKEPMTARELRETLEQERRQRQSYHRSPPPNAITEKDPFRRHDPSAGPAHDENFSRLHQWVHEGYLKPKKYPSNRQTISAPAVVIEKDDSLYAVSEPLSIKTSKPPAAATSPPPSKQDKAAAAHITEIPPSLRRLNKNDDKQNNNKQSPSLFIEEPTMRPCQAPADALASVIHGLEGELSMSKQKLTELVKLYNDHNAAVQKRVRKSLALRIENLLAETERKSDYLYSLHDLVPVLVSGGE